MSRKQCKMLQNQFASDCGVVVRTVINLNYIYGMVHDPLRVCRTGGKLRPLLHSPSRIEFYAGSRAPAKPTENQQISAAKSEWKGVVRSHVFWSQTLQKATINVSIMFMIALRVYSIVQVC